jgi:acetate kinase
MVVFSGVIGENAAEIRARICLGLGFLGIELDPARNSAHAATISRNESRVALRVIRTDEEVQIARSARGVLGP